MNYITSVISFATGYNNLEKAGSALFGTSLKYEKVKDNTADIAATTIGTPYRSGVTATLDYEIIKERDATIWERGSQATKELWTFAGKAGPGLTFSAGGLSQAAKSLGIANEPEANTFRKVAELTFDTSINIVSKGYQATEAIVKFTANQVVSHPKASVAAAGASACVYMIFQGSKDFAKMDQDVIIKIKSAEGKKITVMTRPRTWRECIKLGMKGSVKILSAVALAALTCQTLVMMAKNEVETEKPTIKA